MIYPIFKHLTETFSFFVMVPSWSYKWFIKEWSKNFLVNFLLLVREPTSLLSWWRITFSYLPPASAVHTGRTVNWLAPNSLLATSKISGSIQFWYGILSHEICCLVIQAPGKQKGLMQEAIAGSRHSKIPSCSALTGMSCPLSAASGDGQPQEQGWPLAAAWGLDRKGSKFKYVTCL